MTKRATAITCLFVDKRDSATLDELHIQNEQLLAEEMQQARRHLLMVEKKEVMESFHHGVLNQNAQQKLLADIDARLLHLESTESEKFNGQRS